MNALLIVLAVGITFIASVYCGKWWQLMKNTDVRFAYTDTDEFRNLPAAERHAVLNAFDYVRNYE